MNSYSKELCHWAFGEKKKNHKYIDRIRDTLHDTWKYIYEDKKNVAAKNRQSVKNFADNWRDGAETIKNKVKSAFSRSGNKSFNSAKEKYKAAMVVPSDSIREIDDITPPDIKKKIAEIEAEKKKKEERKQKIENAVDEAKTFVNKILKTVGIDYQLPTKAKKDQNVSVNFVKNYNDVNASASDVKVGVSRSVNYNQVNVPESVKKAPRKPVAKIKFDDGEMRVLYTKEQVEDWTRVQQYQASEPEFMKDVKGIKPDLNGDLPSQKENIEKTNPKFWEDANATVNCWHCSTAYDLRKRGYDVSALPIESEFDDSQLEQIYDIHISKKNNESIDSSIGSSAVVRVNADQIRLDVQDCISRYERDSETGNPVIGTLMKHAGQDGQIAVAGAIKDDRNAIKTSNPINAIAKYVESNPKTTKSDIDKILTDDKKFGDILGDDIVSKVNEFPDNSWGRIGIAWNGNGAHSFQWEKDKNGKITFIDAQRDEIVDIKDYAASAERGWSVQIVRTDHLDLKEKVLEYAKDNNGEQNMSEKEREEKADAILEKMDEVNALYDSGKISKQEAAKRQLALTKEFEALNPFGSA